MKFSFHTDDVTKLQTGLLGLLCFEENLGEGTVYKALDRALEGLLGRVVADEQFKGKKGQSVSLHTHGRIGPTRLLLIGAGARKDFNAAELRAFASRVVKSAAAAQAKQACIVLPYSEGQSQERYAQFVAEGAQLGAYKFDKYLTGDRKKPEVVDEVQLAMSTDNVDPARPNAIDQIKRGVGRAELVAEGVRLARDLINEPAQEMTPRRMAEVAQKVAKQHGLEVKVLGPKECEKLGMGMYLAVSQGSDEEPRFIHLTYKPKGKPAKKKVALVGKGVTFDSGGLSLKPSSAMEDMKVDMSGAAAVIAAIGVLADLNVPYEVHAIAACTENMPSGKSYKLGDVLKSMSGKTVEINNTDAEGRLTLGDAITYVLQEKPDEIFDFATLTGACMVALGPHTAGVMGNDLSLVERWLAAARLAGEDMWHLPLPDKLRDQLKSDIADMRNTGDRYGGALTAGLFLKEFVGDTPWVHVDIAGPASADKEMGHVAKGGTGFGVSTIVEYLASRE